MTVRHDGLVIDWLGYATARIGGSDAVVYTDPGRYGVLTGEWADRYGGDPHPSGPPYEPHDGDIVVVTHDHHYDSDGVKRVAKPDATIVVFDAVSAENIADHSGRSVTEPEALEFDVRRVGYGERLEFGSVSIDVIPAYNRVGGPRADADGTVAHPHGFGCGYVVTIDGIPCFWTGDSDVIDEHDGLDVSLFLPSIARNFTMNRHEAADLASSLDPDLVLPIHYNTFGDLRADSRAFAADVAGRSIPVVLDEAGDRLAL